MDLDPGSDVLDDGSNLSRHNPPSDRSAPAEYISGRIVRQQITNDNWDDSHDDLRGIEKLSKRYDSSKPTAMTPLWACSTTLFYMLSKRTVNYYMGLHNLFVELIVICGK